MLQSIYIETKNGLPLNTDIMCAAEGFEMLGYGIKTFSAADVLSGRYEKLYNKTVFVAGIDTMRSILEISTADRPADIDYPLYYMKPELYGRKIDNKTVAEVLTKYQADEKSVFVKPVDTKKFNGVVLQRESQFSYFENYLDERVFVSEVIKNISSEWRFYVHERKIVGIKHYKGNFWDCQKLNGTTVEKLINSFTDAPSAYTVDLAIALKGITPFEEPYELIVECNDFWAISSYGLEPEKYAEMLRDRYCEIFKIKS